MKVHRLLLGLVLALFARQAVSATCTVWPIATLPIVMSGTQPLVKAKINGVEHRFMIDSGAFFSEISPGSARELALKTVDLPAWFSVIGVGGSVEAKLTTVKSFEIAGPPLRDIEFLVAGSEVGSTGLIGRNILDLADDEFDLANGVVKLMRSAACGDRPMAYWAAGKTASETEVVFSGDRLPASVVSVSVDGVRLRALLDTGSSSSVLSLSAAKRAGLSVDSPGAKFAGQTRGIGRKLVKVWTVPAASFKVGGEEIKNTRISIADLSLPDTDMLLGADFFLSHHVYVSRSQHKMWFTYNGGPVFNLTYVAADAPIEPPPADAGAAPTDAAGFSRRGAAFAGRRDFAHALADDDKAVELSPDNADYVYQRALARLASGQMFLAMSDVEQTLKLRPDDAPARLTRAQLKLAGHDEKGAVVDMDAVAGALSPAADLRLQLAVLYERVGRMEAAIDQFSLWIAAHPDDSRRGQALNGRCWERAQLNRDIDKALADCDAAHRAEPKNGSFLDSRGLAHLRHGDYDKAIADYDASIALLPKSAWSFYGRGLAKLKKGDATGKDDLAMATTLNPRLPDIAAKRGLTP